MQPEFDPTSETSVLRIPLSQEAAKLSPRSAEIWMSASKSESVLKLSTFAPHVAVGCEWASRPHTPQQVVTATGEKALVAGWYIVTSARAGIQPL